MVLGAILSVGRAAILLRSHLWIGAALLPGAALPARAQSAAVAAAVDEIVVEAAPVVGWPERSLSEDDIAGYAAGNIEALLTEIKTETGDEEEPLYIINGQRVSANDFAGLAAEAVQGIKILAPGAGAEYGAAPNQRVYVVVLKGQFNSVTLRASHRLATDGAWNAELDEAAFARIDGDSRTNINFSVRDEESLLESDRGIVQPQPTLPFDLRGNVIPDPRGSATEIDPALSARAGTRVIVAAVPPSSHPTLGDFVAGANTPRVTDLGAFRTLRPATRNYDLNLSYATRLASWLTSSSSVRFIYAENQSLRGLASRALVLPATNAFSPFSQSVGIARYANPLEQSTRALNGEANIGLNATFGKWQMNLNVQDKEAVNRSATERQDPQQSATPLVLADNRNPFDGDLADLLPVWKDHARARTGALFVQTTLNGSPLDLPAGPLGTTFDAQILRTRAASQNTLLGVATSTNVSRTRMAVGVNADIPLTSRAKDVLAVIGDVSANVDYTRIGFSNAAAANRYGYGLTWTPRDWITLNARSNFDHQPPEILALGAPTTVTPSVPVFDVLRGETVDVAQITGGNPSLTGESIRIDRLTANLHPIPKVDFGLNADYFMMERRNMISNLPIESTPIWLAFPQRFTRDASGHLTSVDLRPVNFEGQRLERIRFSFNLNFTLGGTRGPLSADTPSANPTERPDRVRLQIWASHTMFLTNRIDIRPGTPAVDLLAGGAGGDTSVNFGSARPRHQVDLSVGVNTRGLGVRLTGVYRGQSLLQVGSGTTADTITFSPLATANAVIFAEAARFFPNTPQLKATRLVLYVSNLTGARQRVANMSGATPLRYQPGYRDALGRTIELALRKQF